MTLAPEGRKLLRVEQRNSAVPVERKPEWIKAKVQMGPEFVQLKNLVKKGILSRVYAHLLSLSNFNRLLDRKAAKAA